MFPLHQIANDSQAQARIQALAEILADLALNFQGATGHVSANGYHREIEDSVAEDVERFVVSLDVESFGEWVGDSVAQEDAA